VNHTEYICKGGHGYPGCQFCDGGLFSCTVCGGFEGSLTTDCPGIKVDKKKLDEVYSGDIDYREGRGWVVPDGTGTSMGDTEIFCKTQKGEK
jgi:hypothetical protein